MTDDPPLSGEPLDDAGSDVGGPPGDTDRAQRRSLVLALAVAAVVVAIDQVTKAWALWRLDDGPCSSSPDACIDLVGSLRLNLVFNRGAAFSTGTSLGPLFAVIALAMTVVLMNVARQRTDRLGPLLLGLIAGGAVGNLVDRVARATDGLLTGAVVDFIDLQWWPVFNVADSAVVVGVIAFVAYAWFDPDPEGDGGPVDDGGEGPGADRVDPTAQRPGG